MTDSNKEIQELQNRIELLENENRLLRERLNEAGISYADIIEESDDGSLYDPNQGARIKLFDVTDDVANVFFLMFCRGRKDVYDQRYSNPKTGKTGYYTQCFNRWDSGCHIGQRSQWQRCSCYISYAGGESAGIVSGSRNRAGETG